MSTPEEEDYKIHRARRSFFGLAMVLIGIALLFKTLNIDILPYWVYSWWMLLVIWGVFRGIQTGFRDGLSVLFILVGGAFVLQNAYSWDIHLGPIIWPGALIVFGLIMLLKPKDYRRCRRYRHYRYRNWNYENDYRRRYAVPGEESSTSHSENSDWFKKKMNESGKDNDDTIEATAIFCGVNKTILSKHFKGGEIEAIFGGGEIDLSQADIEEDCILDITVVFGGLKLIVPSNWEVRTNITAIAGGVDEKRPKIRGEAANKRLTLVGTVMFGGVEIRNYPSRPLA